MNGNQSTIGHVAPVWQEERRGTLREKEKKPPQNLDTLLMKRARVYP